MRMLMEVGVVIVLGPQRGRELAEGLLPLLFLQMMLLSSKIEWLDINVG
jgi:hypothetical protein